MYNRLDKGREPANLLPRSELNPLTNPVLGKNLGRWAQAYFTSPPEKRERAVSELLRELENEAPTAAATAITSLRITEDVGTEQPFGTVQLPADVLCSACQHRNQRDQRFCGSCGSPLRAVVSAEGYSSAERFSEDPAAHHSATAHPETTVHPENDVQWLRDKALASLKESDTPTSHGWKYLVACGAVLAIGFAYLQWASESPRLRPSAPVATAPAMNPSEPQLQAEQPTTPARTRPEPAASAAASPKNPIIQSTLATRENINKRPVVPSLGSPAGLSTESRSGPPRQPNAEAGGAQELLVAQHYLAGKTGPRDTTEAGKWLWKAVAKQNGTATLLLADLYVRGDGVPKSCDQARLLLVAAAKKGVPEAAQALRNLGSSGCQ